MRNFARQVSPRCGLMMVVVRVSLSFIAVLLFLTSITLAFDGARASTIKTARGTIRVPEDFTIERVAAAPVVKHPMMANFDERGRMFIAASAGKNLRTADLEKELPNFVRMIEDTDGDGVFDRSTIFADRMTLPMGALWYRGSLYVASPPHIWRFQDTDDDGVADKREILGGTFGYTGNAASVHGPFLSPTGRIFWCDGRHGHELKDEAGNVTSRKRGSGIFSMKPDGTDVRMFCGGGMDNPVEVDFWRTGEVLGSVNILYRNPRIDCMVHWQDGGVYPHQEASIAELTRTGDLLGPITKFGHVAVSGMCRYRSAVLGEDFRDNLFTTIFNTGKVMRSKVERVGGTFRTTESEFLTSDDPDFHPTDILEDADGSLLVIDTGGWFRIGCPTSQIAKPEIPGAIYRIRRAGANQVVDPRGLQLNLTQLPLSDLVALLDDVRPAVAERAIEQLSRRDQFGQVPGKYLSGHGTGKLSKTGNINVIWALSRAINRERSEILNSIMTDSSYSDNFRIAAATALTESFQSDADLVVDTEAIAHLLDSTGSAAVRRSLARLVGVVSSQDDRHRTEAMQLQIAPRLLRRLGMDHQLTDQEPTDRPTEHAFIMAAIRIGDREGIQELLNDESPVVRRAALITLDQMEGDNLTRQQVAALLDTEEESLRMAALEVISRREGWASEILSLLTEWLYDDNSDSRSAMIRGFLRSQVSDSSVQKVIANLLSGQTLPQSSRSLLLEVITSSGLETLPADWKSGLERALTHEDLKTRHQAVRATAGFETDAFDQQLAALGNDNSQSAELRIDALRAVARRRDSIRPSEFHFLIKQLDQEVLPLTRVAAAGTLVQYQMTGDQKMKVAELLQKAGPMTLGTLLAPFGRGVSVDLARAVVTSLRALPDDVRLPRDEVMALLDNVPAEVRDEVQALIDDRLESSNDSALMAKMTILSEGDVSRGREIFFGRVAACSSCHRISGQGGQVGPDLTKIGAIRNQRDLLEAIMFPSASFAREYRTWSLVTDSGRVHSGLITRETADSLILRRTDLTEVRVRRDSIEAMRESPKSVMPEGLYHRLSDDELSDLLGFMSSLK